MQISLIEVLLGFSPEESTERKLYETLLSGHAATADQMNLLNRVLKQLFEKQNGHGVQITLTTQVPRQSGLGGSQIIMASLLDILTQAFRGYSVPKKARFSKVQEIEQRLGIRGGVQDTVGSSVAGLKVITFDGVNQPGIHPYTNGNTRTIFESIKEDAMLLYLPETREKRDASRVLESLRDQFYSRDERFLKLVYQSRDRAERMERLINGNFEEADLGGKSREETFKDEWAKDAYYFREMHGQKDVDIDKLYEDAALKELLGTVRVIDASGTEREIARVASQGAEGRAVIALLPALHNGARKLMQWAAKDHRAKLFYMEIAEKGWDFSESGLTFSSKGARLAVGVIADINDDALLVKIKNFAAQAGVDFTVITDVRAAARSQADSRTLSFIIDSSSLDTPESSLAVLRAVRQLQDRKLEKTYGAITRLVALTVARDLDQVAQAEFDEILRGIVAEVPLPSPQAERFELSYEQGRAVLIDAETAFDDLNAFLTKSAAHLNEKDAEAFGQALTQEPGFWQKIMGIDTNSIPTHSSASMDAMLFTWENFEHDKDMTRFREAQENGLNAMVVVTHEEARRAAEKDLDPDRLLVVTNKSLKSIQDAYLDYAAVYGTSGHFVLAAAQKEIENKTLSINEPSASDKKAYVLEVASDSPNTKGLVQATIILLGDWKYKGVLPKFIQDQGGNVFKFLPKAAPIQLAAWMAAVKKQLKSVGAAA